MSAPCLRCSREVLQASVLTPHGGGFFVTLEAEPSPTGEYAIWTHRDGSHWSLRARLVAAGDRLDQEHLHTAHLCAPAGEQLELSTEAASSRPITANSQES